MINKFIAVGRLKDAPLLKKTTSGKSTCNFSLAVERDIKKDGAQNVDWINCVAWDRHAETICRYCSKGSMIGITGRMQTRSYKDHTERTVYVTEVLIETLQLINTNNNNGQNRFAGNSYNNQEYSQNNGYQSESQNASYSDETDTVEISSDDLPF